MAVFQNRPYERHMVTNVTSLLASGLTLADLAIGQIGIFDAKTNLSTVAPTYAANKAIYIAQGTPDHSNFPEGAGVPNVYRKSHTISGRKIQALYGKKANRGQVEIVTLGFDGVDTTKTLSAKPGETFYYYVRLTGDPIFNLNPDRSKGVIVLGAVQMPCADECSDNCGTVDCSIIANKIVEDFNTKLLPGGQLVSKYVKITPLIACTPTYSSTTYDICQLTVADSGSQFDLGQVQAQAPGAYLLNRDNGVSVYAVRKDGSCPSDFQPASITTTDVCDYGSCAGVFVYPSVVFQVRSEGFDITGPTTDAGAIKTKIDALVTPKVSTVTLVQHDTLTNNTTYSVSIANATLADTGVNVAAINNALFNGGTPIGNYITGSTILVGEVPATCTITPDTISWSENENVNCTIYKGTYKLTLKDSVCGTTWAAAITAEYITTGFATNLTTSSSGINCTHEYTIDVFSNCTPTGCTTDQITFPDVPAFEGGVWTFVDLVTTYPAPTTGCVCGVQFESVYVPRTTKEATFDQFAYQTDFVHIEASSHNPDWRSTDLCETDPVATRIQNGAYPNGNGQAVSRLEKADRMYDMDYFYMSPVLREAFDFYFETRFDQYYDQVGIEYDFSYSSNLGFGQTDTDAYRQYVWMPEGQAGALVTALNTYAASALVDVTPIVL